MRVLGTFIYVKIAEQLGSQSVLRKHASYSLLNYSQRLAFEQLLGGCEALSAGITCVSYIHFVCQLFTCEFHFRCVENDYIVSAIHMWGIVDLVLASENKCHSGSKPTQD